MKRVIVYDGLIHIGYGHIYIRADGKMSTPELIDFNGIEIPDGQYTLRVLNEDDRLIVMSRSIQ